MTKLFWKINLVPVRANQAPGDSGSLLLCLGRRSLVIPPFSRKRASLWLILLSGLLAGCHRAPQTVAELREHLPGTYVGEIHLQGRTEAMRLRITPHSLTERSAQVLEFNSVQYAVLDPHGALQTEGDASIHGTITLPGLEVRLESVRDSSAGEDFIKARSFQGRLSDDLQTAEADWTTSYGQKGHLKAEAAR